MEIAILLMTFTTIVLVTYGILASVFSDEVVVKKRLKELDSYEIKDLRMAQPIALPFFDRAVLPFYNKLSSIIRRYSSKELFEKVGLKLARAGNPAGIDVDRFLAMKATSSIVAAMISILLLLNGFSPGKILLGIALVVAFYFLPDLWLKNITDHRIMQIRDALPDTLDLLTISVEAGLGFDAALAKVVKNYPGPLAEEFSRVLHEVQIGVTRKDALKNLVERTDVSELRSFITSIIQAEALGVSITNVLRVQASEMRLKRRQKAEEIAQKAPVKIVFPLIICIFPAIFVAIVGPGVIRIITAFASRF